VTGQHAGDDQFAGSVSTFTCPPEKGGAALAMVMAATSPSASSPSTTTRALKFDAVTSLLAPVE
jgi:hypothetical protein